MGMIINLYNKQYFTTSYILENSIHYWIILNSSGVIWATASQASGKIDAVNTNCIEKLEGRNGLRVQLSLV